MASRQQSVPLLQLVRERRELPPPALRRALREAATVSLEEVGEQLGVSRQTVSRWERGERFPRPQHLVAYAELLRSFRQETS